MLPTAARMKFMSTCISRRAYVPLCRLLPLRSCSHRSTFFRNRNSRKRACNKVIGKHEQYFKIHKYSLIGICASVCVANSP